MILPGLNYDSKLSIDDLSFSAENTEEAILERLKLVFGSGSLVKPKSGIVDVINPAEVVESETTRPLLVYNSQTTALRINVTPGIVVTPNGAIIHLPSLIEDFELIRTAENDIIVVYLENDIIDAPPNRKTRYNVNQYVRRIQDTEVLRSDLLTNFNNSVLYSPTRKDNIVVLAVISVVSSISGLELQIDYTNSSYSFNRPWFSPVDIEHRSYIGSGAVTNTNPHGTTFNDLSSGNFSLYDQLLSIGQIQAKDDDYKGLPGTLCEEAITVSRVLTDGLGSITVGSRFGGAGAKYIVLSKYPVGITSFYLSSHLGRAIAFDHIKGTRIVVLPSPEEITGEATIKYNEVYALEPPASILSNNLTFTQPKADREIVYTSGVAISSFANPSIDFDGSGLVPRNYKVFAKGDGNLIRTPELIQKTIVLDDIGTSLFSISYEIFGPAKISVGLADANAVPTLSVSLRIFGTDENGNSQTEDIAFDDSWVDVSVPGVENENQFVKSESIFYSITGIQILSRTDDGPNSKIVLWAELETGTANDLNKLLEIASVSWNGLSLENLVDKRQIVNKIPEPLNRYQAVGEIFGRGGTEDVFVLSEDLMNPQYKDSTIGYQAATNSAFSIFVDDYSLIQAGDQIEIDSGKTITAITTGTPNRSIGQYLAALSDQDTRNDIVTTINFSGFNSGVTAVANISDSQRVDCTINLAGARGNGPVTELVEGNPAAISLSGNAVGGIDAFGESFIPRHQDYVNVNVPNPATYDVNSIRGRYLSRAIPIGGPLTIKIVVFGTSAPHDSVQVRIRTAVGGDPTWLPWEVATADGSTFSVTKASPIKKIQIEIFGSCSGYALYEVA